jgi:hypothetical protein
MEPMMLLLYLKLQKWENFLFSQSEKIQIFKFNPNIRLLEEKEIENENYHNDEYLIRYNYKLFYINNNSDTKGDNSINEIKIINIAEDVLFNEKNDKKEFIINVIKYDKLLFKNEQIPLFEIKNKNILNKESLEDILKNTF